MIPHPQAVLSPKEMALIHGKSVELLESPGLYLDHDGFLNALKKSGATVDSHNRTVRIPARLAQTAIETAAGKHSLIKGNSRDGTSATELRKSLDSPFRFRFGGSGLEVLSDDYRTPRTAVFSDLERVVRFGNGHPRIQFVGGPPVQYAYDPSGSEIPPHLRPIAGMTYMAKHCTKPGWNEIANADDVQFALRLGSLITDGDTETDPPFLCVKCSISPLKIGADSAEVLWEIAQHGAPAGLAPMPLAGGTSPVTPAANLLVTNTEILGIIVALYAAQSTSRHDHLALTGVMDMQTGIASFSPPNVVLQDVAAAQMYSVYYDIHCDAATDYIDAKFPGYQSGMERALKVATMLSAGIVYPSVGQLKSGLVCSPEQACLDIEAFNWMRHYMRGVEVSEDTLCVDLIREQGIGGHFLGTEHTVESFREELFLPRLADRSAREVKDMVEAAHEEVNRILAATPVYSRDKQLCAEIDELYKLEVERRTHGE